MSGQMERPVIIDEVESMSEAELAYAMLLAALQTIVLGGERIRRAHRRLNERGTPAPMELLPAVPLGTCRELLKCAVLLHPTEDAAEIERMLAQTNAWLHERTDLYDMLTAMLQGQHIGWRLDAAVAHLA